MLLIHLIKILFYVLIIWYIIRWVSYHWHHRNKKARVFNGNCRMPFDVEFALKYGLFKRRKKRVKDLSYRKSLAEWMQLLDTVYPADCESNLVTPKSPKGDFGVEFFSNINMEPFPKLKNKNSNSINNALTLQIQTDLKSPLGDLGVTTRIKKIYNIFTAKPLAKNNRLVSSLLVNTKNYRVNNFKICKNTIPFPKQIFACTHQIFTVWFCFYFFSFLISGSIKK